MHSRIYFAGTQSEMGHHAAPLDGLLDYEICEPDEILHRATPGDVVIFYSEHFDRFRHCCRTLKEKNVATIYMIDGILEWRNAWDNRPDEPACPFAMRPALAHKVACIGAAQARVIESWGNAGKAEIIGVPRFERLRNVEKRAPDSGQFRLLVMTAKCPAFTDTQMGHIRRSLTDLRDWLADNPVINGKQIQVCWRLTGDLDRMLGVQNQLSDLSGAELAQILTSVDAVIGTPTTALLESALLDLPTAILDYTNSPHYVGAAWNISSHSHIEHVVSELTQPPESKLVFQRQLLNDSVYLDSNACKRFTELVLKMQETAAACIAQNRPLSFANNILATPHSTSATNIEFEPEKLFPDHSEFSIAELHQAQSELAHSRREIEHLNQVIQGLRGELGQAHQIFEQIHNHPIAGRVVRVRQKLIDFFARVKQSSDTSPSNKSPSKPVTKTG